MMLRPSMATSTPRVVLSDVPEKEEMSSREDFKTGKAGLGSQSHSPVSEDAAGWSASLPGIEPSGRSEEAFFPLNLAPELELSGFVPVLFARTWEQAEAAVIQLEAEDIPAVLEQGRSRATPFSTLSRGIPVLVPEECFDRASGKIAQREGHKDPFRRDVPGKKDDGDDAHDGDSSNDEDEYEDDDPSEEDDRDLVDDEDDEDDQFDYDDDD